MSVVIFITQLDGSCQFCKCFQRMNSWVCRFAFAFFWSLFHWLLFSSYCFLSPGLGVILSFFLKVVQEGVQFMYLISFFFNIDIYKCKFLSKLAPFAVFHKLQCGCIFVFSSKHLSSLRCLFLDPLRHGLYCLTSILLWASIIYSYYW